MPVGFTQAEKESLGLNTPIKLPSNTSLTLYPLVFVKPRALNVIDTFLRTPSSLVFKNANAKLPCGKMGLFQT